MGNGNNLKDTLKHIASPNPKDVLNSLNRRGQATILNPGF